MNLSYFVRYAFPPVDVNVMLTASTSSNRRTYLEGSSVSNVFIAWASILEMLGI